MSEKQDYDYLYKILLIGNSSVGKSSLLLRFVDSKWNETFVPTIGVDFKVKTMEVEGKKIKLQIWDTAGQERFKNITSNYYRGAHGIMVVYDITETKSFKNITNWLIEIEKNAKKDVYKLLIGNKIDLEEKREVSHTQAKDFADTYGMKFIETSAKNNNNVNESFQFLASEIMKLEEKDKDKLNKKDKKKNMTLTQGSNLNEKKKSCCH